MSTARIDSIDSTNLSALTAELLQESTSKIVALDTSSIPTGKSLRTTTAPRLVEKESDETKALSFLQALAEFMTMIGNAQVFLTQNEAKTNQNQNDIAQKLADAAKKNLEDTIKAIKKYEAAKRKAAHRAFLGKIFGGIAMALGCILALATGGLGLCLVMATLTVLMATHQTDKLDAQLKSWGLNDTECFFVKLAIVIAVSYAGGGIATGVDAAATSVTESAAGDAAAEAIAEEFAAESGVEVSTTSTPVSSNTFMVASQAVVAFNPFVDGMMAFLNAIPGGDKEKKKLAAQILGNLIAIIISMRAGYLAGSSAGTNNSAKIAREALTEKYGAQKLTYLYNALDAVRGSLNGGAQGFNIAAAAAQLQQSDAERDIGQHKKEQTLSEQFLQILNPMIQAQTNLTKQTNDLFAQETNEWNNFIRPGRVAAEILG